MRIMYFFTLIEPGVFDFQITRAEENPHSSFETARTIITKYGSKRSINGLIENERHIWDFEAFINKSNFIQP